MERKGRISWGNKKRHYQLDSKFETSSTETWKHACLGRKLCEQLPEGVCCVYAQMCVYVFVCASLRRDHGMKCYSTCLAMLETCCSNSGTMFGSAVARHWCPHSTPLHMHVNKNDRSKSKRRNYYIPTHVLC